MQKLFRGVIFLSAAIALFGGAFSVQAADGMLRIHTHNYSGGNETFNYTISGPTNTTASVSTVAGSGTTSAGDATPVPAAPGTYSITQNYPNRNAWMVLNTFCSVQLPDGTWQQTGTRAPGSATITGIAVASNLSTYCTFQNVYVYNPAPTITSITPTSEYYDRPFNMTITGTGFTTYSSAPGDPNSYSSKVYINDVLVTSSYASSSTKISASVPANFFTAPGTYKVKVVNPNTGDNGGGTSAELDFTAINYPQNPLPSIVSISPNPVQTGSPAYQIITGSGFTVASKVYVGSLAVPTIMQSETQLVITQFTWSTAGNFDISVVNPAPGGGTSNSLPFSVVNPNPVPTITNITPTSAISGTTNTITLTVNGSNFTTSSSIVGFGNTSLPTTYISPNQLTAQIDQILRDKQYSPYAIKVYTPSPGGGTSNSVNFTIQEAPPPPNGTLKIIKNATGGNTTFNFSVSSVATSIPTTNGTGNISMSLTPGTYAITEYQPNGWSFVSADCDNGSPQSAVVVSGQTTTCTFVDNFNIVENPSPNIANITPTAKTVGDSPFTLTVNGSNFIQTSVIYYGNLALTTQFVSSNQLRAQISSTAVAGTYSISVTNPSPGGGTSNSTIFTINQPNIVPPSINSISPSTYQLQETSSANNTLTVSGSNFIQGAKVYISNTALSTTFVSANQLTATFDSAGFTVGVRPVTVVNPAPSAATSNTVGLTITAAPEAATPTIASITPNATTSGSGGVTISVTGTNFTAQSLVAIGGISRSTTFQSATTVSVTLPAADIATAGAKTITVTNPGGKVSNPVVLTVSAPAAQHAILRITKTTAGGDGTFSFSSSFGNFQITTQGGTGTYRRDDVPPGTYTITENIPSGWQQNANNCTNITLVAGQQYECSIANFKIQNPGGGDGNDGGEGNNTGGGTGGSGGGVNPAWVAVGILPLIIIAFAIVAMLPK